MSRTQQILWQTLQQAGVVQGDMPAKNKDASPWYIKVLLGISGWLAALFLMGFVGLSLSDLWRELSTALVVGVLMIGIACIIFRSAKNEFTEHLALAISLAGQGLSIFALFGLIQNDSLVLFLIGLSQLMLVVLMPSYLHRVFSGFCAAVAFYIAMMSLGFPFVFVSILLLVTVWMWLNEFHYPNYFSLMQPVGYGLVFALLIINGTSWFSSDLWDWRYDVSHSVAQPWMAEVLSGMVVLWMVAQLLRRHFHSLGEKIPVVVFAGTLLLCIVSLEARGITVGIAVLLLGFANSNRILMGLGVVSLLAYLSTYYYCLDTTLLQKSLSLLLIGVVLLALRWALVTFFPVQEGE